MVSSIVRNQARSKRFDFISLTIKRTLSMRRVVQITREQLSSSPKGEHHQLKSTLAKSRQRLEIFAMALARANHARFGLWLSRSR